VHGGDEHGGVGRGCGSDYRDVAGLDPEVQLLGQGVGEAAGELADVVGASQLGLGFGAASQPADHVQVPSDQLVDPGPLHLQDDRGAVGAPGRVRLRKRRAGQRLGIDALEHLAGVLAEFFGQQGLDGRPRRGGHPVLQLGQFGGHRRGQQVGPGGQHLAELDEDRAGLFQRRPQPAPTAASSTTSTMISMTATITLSSCPAALTPVPPRLCPAHCWAARRGAGRSQAEGRAWDRLHGWSAARGAGG
jgi:hypothetical protein